MDLPWQEPLRARLGEAVDGGRLAHAILLTGYPGWGETELCGWLALRLLGVDLARCPRDLAHPDFRWIAPDGGSIKVDSIRALADFALGTAQIAGAKVAVIECAHGMNVNAQNALLKTLEEPPGPMHLILGSDSAGSLMATVRSRCQTFAVPRDRAAAARWIRQPAAKALLDDYDGAPLLALRGAASGERPMAAMLAELAEGRSILDELLGLDANLLCARWMRCLVRTLAGETQAAVGKNLHPRRAMAFADELTRFHDQVGRAGGANVRLLLERLCHHWQVLLRAS